MNIVNSKQGGFVNVALIVLVVVLVGALGYVTLVKKSSKNTQQPSNLISPTQLQTIESQTPESTGIQNQMADWKTYLNARLGIEVKYPPTFVLNSSPSKYWKVANQGSNGVDYSYRFFELVDNQRGCYIGPLREVGLEGWNMNTKSIYTASGNPLGVKYVLFNDGTTYLVHSNIDNPAENYSMSLNLISLSDKLIESEYKNSSFGKSVNDSCIKDFEAILTTLKFTK